MPVSDRYMRNSAVGKYGRNRISEWVDNKFQPWVYHKLCIHTTDKLFVTRYSPSVVLLLLLLTSTVVPMSLSAVVTPTSSSFGQVH